MVHPASLDEDQNRTASGGRIVACTANGPQSVVINLPITMDQSPSSRKGPSPGVDASAARMDLVPSLSPPALKMAVDNGADCVYLGLRDATNARNFAG